MIIIVSILAFTVVTIPIFRYRYGEKDRLSFTFFSIFMHLLILALMGICFVYIMHESLNYSIDVSVPKTIKYLFYDRPTAD